MGAPEIGAGSRARRDSRMKRTLIAIGLDSADPWLLDQWVSQGYLPNISSLREQGSYCPLRGPDLYLSEQAWTLVCTGCEARRTGYWSRWKFDPPPTSCATPGLTISKSILPSTRSGTSTAAPSSTCRKPAVRSRARHSGARLGRALRQDTAATPIRQPCSSSSSGRTDAIPRSIAIMRAIGTLLPWRGWRELSTKGSRAGVRSAGICFAARRGTFSSPSLGRHIRRGTSSGTSARSIR